MGYEKRNELAFELVVWSFTKQTCCPRVILSYELNAAFPVIAFAVFLLNIFTRKNNFYHIYTFKLL